MDTFAAVVTAKSSGAISTVQLFGKKAEAILKKIFKSTAGKQASFQMGKILLGIIYNDKKKVDQVTIGCESENNFAINCHGNPIITAEIMEILDKHGVKLVTADELWVKILSSQKISNTIELEAELTQPKAKTLNGTKIVLNQKNALVNQAKQWLADIGKMSFDEMKTQIRQILKNTKIAKLIIFGCKIALTGPANTGKSTLLNCLAAKQKAIVTDIEGTTRDYVTASCKLGGLYAEITDTAGLTNKPIQNNIEEQSQNKSLQILKQADLILLVLDNSKDNSQLNEKLIKTITNKPLLTVLNKSDLPAVFDSSGLDKESFVKISAKLAKNTEELIEKIQRKIGIDSFDMQSAVCITSREVNLLKQLLKTDDIKEADSIITELLSGRFSV